MYDRMVKNLMTVVAILIFFGIPLAASFYEVRYERRGQVILVENEVATIEDTRGYLWQVEDEDLKAGQFITMVMDDRHSSLISDDIIVAIKR